MVYLNFQTSGINFLLCFGQLCDKKTCAFVVMGTEKRLCGLEVGWAEVIRQTVSFLLGCVCVCVCVCRAEGGLRGHNQASNVALLFLTKRPLHLVFNREATIVLNRISSLHIV